MYKKCEHLLPIVMGHRIEPCILVYSDYSDKKGAVSVVVAECNQDELPTKLVEFREKHPLFDQKYEYADMSWKCVENKRCMVSVFKFKHERKI